MYCFFHLRRNLFSWQGKDSAFNCRFRFAKAPAKTHTVTAIMPLKIIGLDCCSHPFGRPSGCILRSKLSQIYYKYLEITKTLEDFFLPKAQFFHFFRHVRGLAANWEG